MAIVLCGRADDVAPFLPDVRRERLFDMAAAVPRILHGIDATAAGIPKDAPRKDAALTVMSSPNAGWIGPILDIWSGRLPSAHAWLERQKVPETSVFKDSLVDRFVTEWAAKALQCYNKNT
jgi:hypothetical protein